MENQKLKKKQNYFLNELFCLEMMDRFERKEMEKERPIKNTWYDWLINYVPRPIRKTVGGFKDSVKSV